MPKCRDCGAEIQWLETPSGKMAPYDVEPVLHFRTCKARKKPKGKERAQPTDVQLQADAIALLRTLGYKATEAREMLQGLSAESVEDLVAQALRNAGEASWRLDT